MVPSSLYQHGEPDPVCLENLDFPGDHAVACQDVESPVPVQGIIRLMKVQEYLI